jgi:transcriptional regulator with XRE-family HTH domain
MPIKGHLEQSGPDHNNRQHERRSLTLETSGNLPSGEQSNLVIHNISAGGMLIESSLDLAVGSKLAVNLPHEDAVPAAIVWASGTLFGCRFDRPIGKAALSAVELKSDAALPDQLAQLAPRNSGGIVLGKKLEQKRKARGLTLAQVADRLGVSKPTVWAWEKGKARPVEDRFPAIAQVLGLSEEDLFARSEPNSVSELLSASREQIAQAIGIEPRQVRILIEI